MLTLDSILRRAADVRHRLVGEEAVVLRQRAGEVLGLNEVGGRLLDLLDARTPVSGLLERLAAEFEVGQARLEEDVLAFLDRLVEVGVAEEVASGTARAEPRP
jgi:hypothetical protein